MSGHCRHHDEDALTAAIAIQSGSCPHPRHVLPGYRELLPPRTPRSCAALVVGYLLNLFLLACWQVGLPYPWLLAGAVVALIAEFSVYAAIVGWVLEIGAARSLECECDTTPEGVNAQLGDGGE